MLGVLHMITPGVLVQVEDNAKSAVICIILCSTNLDPVRPANQSSEKDPVRPSIHPIKDLVRPGVIPIKDHVRPRGIKKGHVRLEAERLKMRPMKLFLTRLGRPKQIRPNDKVLVQ